MEATTTDVNVRQHNGQCGYGLWMSIDDPEVPAWVGSLIADDIAENGNVQGRVSQGGSTWTWRKWSNS